MQAPAERHERCVVRDEKYHRLSPCTSVINLKTTSSTCPPTSSLSFSSSQVKKQLERMTQNKAAEPDGVNPRVLRPVLFNLSPSQEKVPVLSMTSCLVPVPKNIIRCP